MPWTRVWDQVIGVFPPYLSLTLIHPDGRGHTHWTDLEFLEEVESRNWCENSQDYAISRKGSEVISLHWLPLGKPLKEMTIDHMDRNIFNSCRDNLRIVSNRANQHNAKTHGNLGPCIHWSLTHHNWRVSITIGKERLFYPAFKSPTQAMACRDMYLAIATAYDRNERELPTREELKTIADRIKRGEI